MHKCEKETFLNILNIIKSTVLFEQVNESTFINYKIQNIYLIKKYAVGWRALIIKIA